MGNYGKPRARAWRYLEHDGGWLTSEGIAMAVDQDPETVNRSMWRWRQAGHVESRQVLLAYAAGVNRSGRNRSNMEARREWKAA